MRISLKQLISRHMLEVATGRRLRARRPTIARCARVIALLKRSALRFVDFKARAIDIKLDLAGEPGVTHDLSQLLAYVEWFLFRRDAYVHVNRALLNGPGDLIGHAAADRADIHVWHDSAAGALIAVFLLVFIGPCFDPLDETSIFARWHSDFFRSDVGRSM